MTITDIATSAALPYCYSVRHKHGIDIYAMNSGVSEHFRLLGTLKARSAIPDNELNRYDWFVDHALKKRPPVQKERYTLFFKNCLAVYDKKLIYPLLKASDKIYINLIQDMPLADNAFVSTYCPQEFEFLREDAGALKKYGVNDLLMSTLFDKEDARVIIKAVSEALEDICTVFSLSPSELCFSELNGGGFNIKAVTETYCSKAIAGTYCEANTEIVLKYKKNESATRLKFILYHEIGHYLDYCFGNLFWDKTDRKKFTECCISSLGLNTEIGRKANRLMNIIAQDGPGTFYRKIIKPLAKKVRCSNATEPIELFAYAFSYSVACAVVQMKESDEEKNFGLGKIHPLMEEFVKDLFVKRRNCVDAETAKAIDFLGDKYDMLSPEDQKEVLAYIKLLRSQEKYQQKPC